MNESAATSGSNDVAIQEKNRLEALSDGVFAIAITLLIINVLTVTNFTGGATHVPLATQLARAWPTFVAYLVGFLTILVCWINHHRVFFYVRATDTGLVWINGLQLALVSAVPFPTAVLAANLTNEDSRTAFLLYGVTYVLMALSFWGLWRHVDRRGLTDRSRDAERYAGVATIYRFAIVWTLLCLAVAAVAVYLALVMWLVMFAIFAFPAEFSVLAARWSNRRATR